MLYMEEDITMKSSTELEIKTVTVKQVQLENLHRQNTVTAVSRAERLGRVGLHKTSWANSNTKAEGLQGSRGRPGTLLEGKSRGCD